MRSPLFVSFSLLLALGGCNALTGADQFTIDGDGESDGGDGAGSSTGNGSGSGNGSGNGSGTGSASGTTTGGPVESFGDATGINISEVAFYQGLKSTVFDGGPTSPSVTLVAGRPAVVRVFTEVSGLSGAPITARLTMGASAPIEVAVSNPQNSSDSNYQSTINFEVPAAQMQSGTSYQIELLEDIGTASENPGASIPSAALSLQQSGPLKVTLIPVRYGADGSNRLPDTSAAQVKAYKDVFMAMYPASEVIVTVGQQLTWNSSISAGGNGWDSLLNQISSIRQSSSADFDEYYYGIFNPASTFGAFCNGGCVAGLGFIGDPNGEYSRAAIGLGYGGELSTGTAAHEVGHNHGRPHSPCGGVSGADPSYPHSGGAIGEWGMDIFSKTLYSPSVKDFMGYCDPVWISDYCYEKVLDFMQAASSSDVYVPPEAMNQGYERINFGPSGDAFLDPIVMKRPPMGPQKTVTVTTADGQTQQVTGTFFAYDHLEGGVLFVKKPSSTIVSVGVEVAKFGLPQLVNVGR